MDLLTLFLLWTAGGLITLGTWFIWYGPRRQTMQAELRQRLGSPPMIERMSELCVCLAIYCAWPLFWLSIGWVSLQSWRHYRRACYLVDRAEWLTREWERLQEQAARFQADHKRDEQEPDP